MFESAKRLREDVAGLLGALCSLGGGRYAAVFDRTGLVAETDQPGDTSSDVRPFVRKHTSDLLGIPAAMKRDEPFDDPFAAWDRDEFFLAVVNGRVGILLACADAREVQASSGKLLSVLVDRLLRLNAAWRVDETGRGLFGGRPRLDSVVIGRPEPNHP